ncbi:DNA polymerase epsilon subunit 3 [Psilocybe cubensis]|uniref:DNA polymerase epsilon subunit 3 n=1 Tax=Psilocybe cubensis TaxID=181762 RepID=A0ACB8GJ25_PSICU|nr:DNA polymerase epsilon subunit 3 [Psilocybe cubensis]KAH9475069.1 DNA polymerase epsilon subunit 3 [Psilocybe cubensis]
MPRKETYAGPLSAQAQQDLVSEGLENYELPKSVVMKIAKSALPDNVKLQKETVLSLVKGSSVFINYLAHDVAQNKQHKSISASDVLKALEMIEFGDMVNKLQSELLIYREVSKNDKGKKGTTNGTSSARKAPQSSTSAPPKSKGKEKPGALPPPFTSAPLAAASSHSQGDTPMDIDDQTTSISAHGRSAGDDEDDEVNSATSDGELGNALEDDAGIEEEEEEEELVDNVALEEEELRNDSKGMDRDSDSDMV